MRARSLEERITESVHELEARGIDATAVFLAPHAYAELLRDFIRDPTRRLDPVPEARFLGLRLHLAKGIGCDFFLGVAERKPVDPSSPK